MMKLFAILILLFSSLKASYLTLDEKIGQLFIVAGYVDPNFASKENAPFDLDQLIKEYHIGGIAFVGPSSCAKQAILTSHYQQISRMPLLIAQDLECGLGMRHTDGMNFPKNTTLGAVADNQLIYEMGKEIGRQAKLIGVHMNLSPVLDVNSDPENIVINVRSFGSSPQLVAAKGCAMIKGLQDSGIIANAKHFPGLGDIHTDPHLNLPCSHHGRQRLEEVEFYPFAQAIKAGVLSIQTEHLMVPTLDPHYPASLSPLFVTEILKKELGFKGLILSGALRMKALTDHFSHEEIAVQALRAGSDMLLMPQDLPLAHRAIKEAVIRGDISEKEIDERVSKILALKKKIALPLSIPTQEQLVTPHALALKQQLLEAATQYIRGKPVSLTNKSIAYIQLGENPSLIAEQLQATTARDLYQFDHIILAVFPKDPRRITEIRLLNEKRQQEELKDFKVHGITESDAKLISALQPYQHKITVVYFGNPYGLHFFDGYSNLIMAHESDLDAQKAALRRILPFERPPLRR